MRDADTRTFRYEHCAIQHGGRWATQGMMGSGMMRRQNMMGPGWRHSNGTYGMLFTFTTT